MTVYCSPFSVASLLRTLLSCLGMYDSRETFSFLWSNPHFSLTSSPQTSSPVFYQAWCMIESLQQRHCGMMKCWTYLKPFSQRTGADIEYPASSCVTIQKGWLAELHNGLRQWPALQLAFRLSSPSSTLPSAAWSRKESSLHFFSAIAFYWCSLGSVQIRGLH